MHKVASSSAGSKTLPHYAKRHKLEDKAEKFKNMVLFASSYSKKLPVRIKTSSGYVGLTNQTTILPEECFDVHCMKHTKVVKADLCQGSKSYIPMNSAIQFSILYNPKNNLLEAKSGYTFETVAELKAQGTMPKVICATKSWQGDSEKSTVHQKEVLIPLESKKAEGLKVFSTTDYQEKLLPKACVGCFTTNPELIRLYLSELVELVTNLFPSTALAHTSRDILAHKLPSTVVLLGSVNNTSLVAARKGVTLSPEYENTLVELPLALPLEVSISELETQDLRSLYNEARATLDQFSPKNIKTYFHTECNTPDAEMTQTLLYTTVRQGFEKLGISLVCNPIPNVSQDVDDNVLLRHCWV